MAGISSEVFDPDSERQSLLSVDPKLPGKLDMANGAEVEDGSRKNVLGRTGAVDLNQQIQLLVVLNEGLSAGVVGLKAHLNGFRLVVVPLKETAIASIAVIFESRRAVVYVIDGFTFLTGSPPGQAFDDLDRSEGCSSVPRATGLRDSRASIAAKQPALGFAGTRPK